jgi:hypothetical protein
MPAKKKTKQPNSSSPPVNPKDELNKLQTEDSSYIHAGVPTTFLDIKQNDLLWAIAVNNKNAHFKKTLIKVLSVETDHTDNLIITFKWILYTMPPWNEHRCIIIGPSTKNKRIYEHKYITDYYDNKQSIHPNKKLILHEVFETNKITLDSELKGIKFVHTDDANYLANLEQRKPLLQIAQSVKAQPPYHLLGSIKLNEKIHTKATLDSRGIISNIMPRQQAFPLNIVPCNAPTFEHEDHWYRYVQYHQLSKPFSDTTDYINKFRTITDNNVYSEHFYEQNAPNPYINGNGAKGPTETLGLVTLNCYAQNIISIMEVHKEVFEVSTVILLQEVSGLIPKDGKSQPLKKKNKWILIDDYGYLPLLSEDVENKKSVFANSVSGDKQRKFETDNNITTITTQAIGHHQQNSIPKKQIECFDFSDSAIQKYPYLNNYEIVFTTEKLNVSETSTDYETIKSKKLAIIVKKGYWSEMKVSILSYRQTAIVSTDNTAISAIDDSIVLCLALTNPIKGWKPIIVCSAHMTAESDQNREAMNRQFYHMVLPNLKITAKPILEAEGYVIVGNDANMNNVDLTASVQEYDSKDTSKFLLTKSAQDFYENTVIGLANNNVTTHTKVNKNGTKFNTSSFDNIVFVVSLQLPSSQFVHTIKVPVYIGLRLLAKPSDPGYSDHSPVACRVGNVEIQLLDRKYYKLPDFTIEEITHDNLLTKFKDLEANYKKQETEMKSQHSKFKFVTMVERAQVETLRKLNRELWKSIYSIKNLVNSFNTRNKTHTSQVLKNIVDHQIENIVLIARRLLNLQDDDDMDFSCYYTGSCYVNTDDENNDDEMSELPQPTKRKTKLQKMVSSPKNKHQGGPQDGQQGGPKDISPMVSSLQGEHQGGPKDISPMVSSSQGEHQGGPKGGPPDGQQGSSPMVSSPKGEHQGGPPDGQQGSSPMVFFPQDGQQGGSINKIQIIKEQIKIIKDKYKNTKLDKYLIQIDNLKHKIILHTFTDKLLKIKEKIKDYKTEMNANPNKKEKYIKHINKFVEKFNILKQKQDILKQNIKLKHTKDPKPTKKTKPTKDLKLTKDPKPTKESIKDPKPTKNPIKNPNPLKT